MIYLGIDTSNYKTSVAAVDNDGRILCNISEYLDVPHGKRGLRQSEVFFMHSNRLPLILSDALKTINPDEIAAIGVSDRPRRTEGSYMPCFLAGLNTARVMSDILRVPMHSFSHQEGHAAAIIEKSEVPVTDSNSLLMHLSGGTTEILKCIRDDTAYRLDIVGGTLDISIGQLLDRFGVALGFHFPSGMFIDKLAGAYKGGPLPGIVPGIRIMDGYFNLSGPENELLKFARSFAENHGTGENTDDSVHIENEELSAVCYELMERIADVLLISSNYLTSAYNADTVYMAGGVASSDTLRKIINEKSEECKYRIVFGDAYLSGDNAVGTALLARRNEVKPS